MGSKIQHSWISMKQNQTHRYREQTSDCRGGGGRVVWRRIGISFSVPSCKTKIILYSRINILTKITAMEVFSFIYVMWCIIRLGHWIYSVAASCSLLGIVKFNVGHFWYNVCHIGLFSWLKREKNHNHK